MSHGAYHPLRKPNGQVVRKDDELDGRTLKVLHRDTPYYVRLELEWFKRLERLLDVPANREAGTAVSGCRARADLIEHGFKTFLRIDELAREMNYRNVDDLVTHLIQGYRFLQRQTAAPEWLSIEAPRVALPPPAQADKEKGGEHG